MPAEDRAKPFAISKSAGRPAKWAEGQRIDLRASQTKSRDKVQAEQMTAVRPERLGGPAVRHEMFDDLEIVRQTVAMGWVEQ